MKPTMSPTSISGSVLWAPAGEIELAAGDDKSPVLEFTVLLPIDLTETHGIDITLARLEEMVRAYDPAIEMASLNLDHNYAGPSHGWCEKVWMEEKGFRARYIDLDPDTVELVRTKRYTRRSAELALNHPVTGGWYFTGCALLGNARPAVPGLPPVTLCRHQYILQGEESSVKPEPPAPPAPVLPPTGEAELLAALRAKVAEGDQAVLSILRQNAELSVDKRLAQLGSRVTHAVAKLVRPLLVELLSVSTPATVKLQVDEPAKPAADVSIAERIFEILAAAPAVEALTSGRLADEEVEAAAAIGLTPERRRELDARYRFTTNAFGFRGN